MTDDLAASLPSQPERMASPLFRGALAQVLRATIEWLALDANEVLVCEREEDFDRIAGDLKREITAHQVKDITGRISARDDEVREAIAGFAIAFHHYERQGIRCRMVFTTTAAAVLQKVDRVLVVDVLEHWRRYTESEPTHRDDELIASIKALEQFRSVSSPGGKARFALVSDAHRFLDTGQWDTFLRAVTWRLSAENVGAVHRRLLTELEADRRFSQFDSRLILARLVGEVLERTARDDLTGRALTRRDLESIALETERQHVAWSEKRPLVQWLTSLEADLSEVQERLDALEGNEAGVKQSPWPTYTALLHARVHELSVLGLPAIRLPVASALPVELEHAGDRTARFSGAFLHLKDKNRIVVTGPPGGGKSALTRIAAAAAIAAGVRVVRGRVKVVAAELRRGAPVADAVAVSLAEGFMSLAQTRRLLAEAELVLLDGLDESDACRDLVIEFARTWSSNTKLVVTSRDEDDATQLPGFEHLHLRQISRDDAVEFARRVAALDGRVTATALARAGELFGSHAVLATPLLAGFAVALSFAAESSPLPTSDATLYQRILRLLASGTRNDRTFQVTMDADKAIAIFSSLAWLQGERPSADLSDLKCSLRAMYGEDGAIAVEFWEERGLLECRTGVLRDEIEFSHESLREFGLALHIARLASEDLRRLAEVNRDNGAWFQPLRFAAQLGRLQPVLQGVLASSDHLMTLRAARLVVAAQGPFDAVLVERLILAFKSDIPRVVSEASTFLADSVAAGGDSSQVLSAFGTHQEHSNNWSRLGALMIRVELVAHRLQDDDVVAWLMEEIDRHRDNSPGFRDRAQYWWPTFQDLLVRAMPALYKNSGADRVVTLLNELETRDLCSHYLLAAIDEWALKISAGSIRESVASVRAKHGREWTEKFRSQGAMSLEEYEEERLEGLYLTLAEACPDENGEPDRGVAFMVALESFGYMARPTTESTVFRKPHLRTVLAPILREWVDALGLSPSAVGSYARLMLKSRPYLIGTVDWPRPPARRPDWNIDRIRQRGLDIAHLVHLLDRSRGNVLLSQLLGPIVLAWRPLEEIDVAISGLASGFNAETWEWVARHASALWGNASKDKAEAMLGKVAGPGTVWLLAVASDAVVARNRDRIREALRSTDVAAERAPRVSDARISAWMLAQLTDEAVLLDAWIALDDWTRRPVVDNPRAMPDSPCDLLAQLILARDATDVVLAKLSQHPSRQVREEVLKSVRQAPFDRDRWNLLLGTSTHAQMIAALRSGSSAQELEWLIAQVDNSDADVRRLVAQALVGSSASQPVTAALQRLQHDPDPAVRDAAFATLAVRQGEEGPAEH